MAPLEARVASIVPLRGWRARPNHFTHARSLRLVCGVFAKNLRGGGGGGLLPEIRFFDSVTGHKKMQWRVKIGNYGCSEVNKAA